MNELNLIFINIIIFKVDINMNKNTYLFKNQFFFIIGDWVFAKGPYCFY